MDCSATQKVHYGTLMLAGEVDDWWVFTRLRLEDVGEVITWAVFTRELMRNYFPKDVRGKKEMEFLALCQIYEEDNIAHSTHYKSLNKKRGKLHHDRKKPNNAPDDKGKQKVFDWRKTSGGGTPATVRCYRCGEQGSYINIQCQKPKKDVNSAKNNGRVFALSGAEDSKKDNLIRDTLDRGYVATTFVCKECTLTIFDKSFMMDLVCLPLHQIDVILGMIWLEFNYVHINCYNKTLRFPKFGDNEELMLLTAKQVSECLRDEVVMFAVFALLQSNHEATSVELPFVCEFPEVFLDDISDLPPKCEVEFST
ncbi:uncharacterized protein LOC131649782 [Vicia villosa]|uniref:uncharacterized protein LOC131649782 n=1 Tax=Vicia villosa TaxID=3911 RepID=UPI00273C6458|nr:uncharacterized protein LOC131649782 [Vicia villosa]